MGAGDTSSWRASARGAASDLFRPARRHESRLERVSRRTIGVAAANFGVVAVLTRSYLGMTGWVAALVWVLAILSFVAGGIWLWTRFWVDGIGARMFAVFADVGTLLVVLTVTPREDAIIGCALFAVTGIFFIFYLPRPWLVAHVVFAGVATIALTVWAIADGQAVAYVISRTDIVLVTIIGPTLTMELAWSTFRRRAQLAGTDALTGVLNLRGMWQEMIPTISDAAAAEHAVAVAVADIDGFKAVNDDFGHDVGDEVLIRVARELSDHVGSAGFVARSGGEEFTIVVDGDLDDVREITARIPTEFVGGPQAPSVTMSIGVAVALPARTDRDAARDARRRADTTMYRVKEAGGNGVHVDF